MFVTFNYFLCWKKTNLLEIFDRCLTFFNILNNKPSIFQDRHMNNWISFITILHRVIKLSCGEKTELFIEVTEPDESANSVSVQMLCTESITRHEKTSQHYFFNLHFFDHLVFINWECSISKMVCHLICAYRDNDRSLLSLVLCHPTSKCQLRWHSNMKPT